MSYCIAFRKNGLYETLVTRAVEGINDIRVLGIESSATFEGVKNLFSIAENDEVYRSRLLGDRPVDAYRMSFLYGVSDITVRRALQEIDGLGSVGITLDSIIANAIQKDLACSSQKELCADLFAKAKAMMGQPPRVIIVTDNLEDHASSVKNEADTACQFWTDVIVQTVGTQPTMMSHEEYKNSSDILDCEWVLVDRHVQSRKRSFPWGLVMYIPIENLLESLVTLGIAPSGSWQDSAVEAIRSHILSKVNS